MWLFDLHIYGGHYHSKVQLLKCLLSQAGSSWVPQRAHTGPCDFLTAVIFLG